VQEFDDKQLQAMVKRVDVNSEGAAQRRNAWNLWGSPRGGGGGTIDDGQINFEEFVGMMHGKGVS
jgi:hypothetical protein